MRAMHDDEAQRLSEELEDKNKEIKEAELREKKLKVRVWFLSNWF